MCMRDDGGNAGGAWGTGHCVCWGALGVAWRGECLFLTNTGQGGRGQWVLSLWAAPRQCVTGSAGCQHPPGAHTERQACAQWGCGLTVPTAQCAQALHPQQCTGSAASVVCTSTALTAHRRCCPGRVSRCGHHWFAQGSAGAAGALAVPAGPRSGGSSMQRSVCWQCAQCTACVGSVPAASPAQCAQAVCGQAVHCLWAQWDACRQCAGSVCSDAQAACTGQCTDRVLGAGCAGSRLAVCMGQAASWQCPGSVRCSMGRLWGSTWAGGCVQAAWGDAQAVRTAGCPGVGQCSGTVLHPACRQRVCWQHVALW